MNENDSLQISVAASIIYRKTQMWKDVHYLDSELTSAQIPVLITVCRKEGISQNELVELLMMDKSTVAKLIGKLVESGYLLRLPNAKDKRAYDLLPSTKAMNLYPRLLENGVIWENTLTKGMSADEVKILKRLLTLATQNATEYSKEI